MSKMEFITSLYPLQQKAVDKLQYVKVGALYMEMGTGKTRTALELIIRRLQAGKISQVLWLCPYSVAPDLPELLSEHISTDFMSICNICGIESLSNSMRIYGDILRYVSSAPTYLIVDESLLVKNPQAYRTRRVIDISQKFEYKLILNGTPISKSVADLFSQWYILDWRILGYKSFWSFAANHLEYDPERPGRVVRAHNVEYLSKKIAPYTFEARKQDVLSLPKKHSPKINGFYLTPEQAHNYDEITYALIEQLDDQRPETVYRLFGAAQSITSGFEVFLTDEGRHANRRVIYRPEDNPRICRLLNILEDIGNNQAVIYCHFTQEIKDIIKILGSSALPYYGEMNTSARQENKTRFKRGESQYLVCNKSCAQFGLNLQFCWNEIFYNNDWDWSTRVQAEDRLHRNGQKHEVYIYDIKAYDSIDEIVLQSLDRKENLVQAFLYEIRSNNNVKDIASKLLHGKVR